MARASSIWLVYHESGTVVAAFTVRHEMLTWVSSQPEPVSTWTVHRLPDNPSGSEMCHRIPELVDLKALL